MKRFVEGEDRGQSTLFPEYLEDWIGRPPLKPARRSELPSPQSVDAPPGRFRATKTRTRRRYFEKSLKDQLVGTWTRRIRAGQPVGVAQDVFTTLS
jgi:hypothetical protein